MSQHPLFLYRYYHGYTVQAGRVKIFESHRNGMTQHPLFSYHYYHGYTVQAGRVGIFESPTGMVCLNIILIQSHSFHNMVTWLVEWNSNLSKVDWESLKAPCVSTSYSFHAIVTTYKSTSYMVCTGRLCYFNSQ